MMSALPFEIEMVIHQQVHNMHMADVMREMRVNASRCTYGGISDEEWAAIMPLTCRQRGIRFCVKNLAEHAPGSVIHARHAARLARLMEEEEADAPNDGSEPPLP
jgi:hypothetical protein